MHSKKDLKNFRKITVEPIQDLSAVLIGITLICLFFFVRSSYIKYKEGVVFSYSWFYAIFLIGIPVFSRLLFLPWITNLSKRLGFNIKAWALFGLINPNISLIILGLTDLKLQSKKANSIVVEKRREYGKELFQLKNNISNRKELKIKTKSLKQEFNKRLQEELENYYTEKD